MIFLLGGFVESHSFATLLQECKRAPSAHTFRLMIVSLDFVAFVCYFNIINGNVRLCLT